MKKLDQKFENWKIKNGIIWDILQIEQQIQIKKFYKTLNK
tara:strand:- start:8032 stop:8151 length:120 start_codon:yes stop_codon:yes gene_type:complete